CLGVVAADTLDKYGLELSELSASTMEKLGAVLSGRWSRGNPVDTSGDISYPCLLPLLEDGNVDAVIIAGPIWGPAGLSAFISTPPWERDYQAGLEALLQAVEEESLRNLNLTMELMKRFGKPVMLSVWVAGEVKGGALYRALEENNLVPYPAPDRAAKALARLVEYSRYLGIARPAAG
ncbi:MAG: hypothetical protein IBX68_03635, partial [Dehalococcoidia bacterium]|nr:hypothetical protein [Dehalococcoidia bacterium]